MILAHPQLDTVFDFSGDQINTLIVEDPDFYRAILMDFFEQLDNLPGNFVLSENGATLAIGKYVELIDNSLRLDLNKKPILNKVCAAMEQIAISEKYFIKTAELLGELERFMDELAFSFDCDIRCEKCSVSGLLKAMGISLRDDYDDPLEKLVDYMEIVREFEREKLFVIVGLRSLFGNMAVERFMQTVLSHGYIVLLVDCVDREKLPLERRITIDKDLCEF